MSYLETSGSLVSPHSESSKKSVSERNALVQQRLHQEKLRLSDALASNNRKTEALRQAREAERAARIAEQRERERSRAARAAERRRLLDDERQSKRATTHELNTSMNISDVKNRSISVLNKSVISKPASVASSINNNGLHASVAGRPQTSYAFGSSTSRGLSFLGLSAPKVVAGGPAVKSFKSFKGSSESLENHQSEIVSKRRPKTLAIAGVSNSMTQSMYVPKPTSDTSAKPRTANVATSNPRNKSQSRPIADKTVKLSSKAQDTKPPVTIDKSKTVGCVGKSTAVETANSRPPLLASQQRQTAEKRVLKVPGSAEKTIQMKQANTNELRKSTTKTVEEYENQNLDAASQQSASLIEAKNCTVSNDDIVVKNTSIVVNEVPNDAKTVETAFERRSSEFLNENSSGDEATQIFGGKTPKTEEQAKAALAENRRLVRERLEREKEAQRLEEEQTRMAEEIEFQRQQDEALALSREAKLAEEERLRLACEKMALQKQEEEEKKQQEAQKLTELAEIDAKNRELADKADREREEKLKRDELDRLERKKKLESILRRTRTPNITPSKNENNNVDNLYAISSSDGNLSGLTDESDSRFDVSETAKINGESEKTTNVDQKPSESDSVIDPLATTLQNITVFSPGGGTIVDECINFSNGVLSTDHLIISSPKALNSDIAQNVITSESFSCEVNDDAMKSPRTLTHHTPQYPTIEISTSATKVTQGGGDLLETSDGITFDNLSPNGIDQRNTTGDIVVENDQATVNGRRLSVSSTHEEVHDDFSASRNDSINPQFEMETAIKSTIVENPPTWFDVNATNRILKNDNETIIDGNIEQQDPIENVSMTNLTNEPKMIKISESTKNQDDLTNNNVNETQTNLINF